MNWIDINAINIVFEIQEIFFQVKVLCVSRLCIDNGITAAILCRINFVISNV
ncbi:hypothetical protein D3C81_908390 [compost metagenome]